MKKMLIAGLALIVTGGIIFGAGFLGARGDLSVVNGNLGPFRVHLTDGRVESGFMTTGPHGIGGDRSGISDPVLPSGSTSPSTVSSRSQENMTFPSEGIKSIVINERCADVEIWPSDDENIYVYAETWDGCYCEANSRGGVLSIERKTPNWIFGLNLGSDRQSTLRVLVPEGLACNMDIDSSFGSVSVSDLRFNEVSIDADMGDVSFENVLCAGAELDADCGDVLVRSVECSGDLSADTDMGNVTIDGVSVSRELSADSSCGNVAVSSASAGSAELSSDMGDVRAFDLTCVSSAKLDCDCGSIEVRALKAGKEIEMENSMGSIEGTLAGSMDDYSIESGTDLGSNNLPQELQRAGVLLKVFADCGSIDIGFEGS